jgi:acyl-CoA synthetase (NDP forming)
LAIIANAAGPGFLAADVAASAGVELATRTVANPLDLTVTASPQAFGDAVTEALADDGVDGVLVIGVPPLTGSFDAIGRAVADAAAARGDKPVVASYLGRVPVPGVAVVPGTEDALRPIPLFSFPEPAVRAFGRVAAYGEWRHADEGALVVPEGVDGAAATTLADGVLHEAPGGRWLEDGEAAALLACAGIEVGSASAEKGANDGGGPDGTDLLIGLVDDPSFGPLLRFGLCGLAAELLGDRGYRILPLTDVDAARLLRSTRLSPLLFGEGGRTPVDEAALVDLLLRVSALAEAVPQLAELELQPVTASSAGIAVGRARARLAPPPTGPGPLLRRLR